jgi:ubiquinone/menaquinone biosynthesis C-methylase UbiE
MDNQEPTVLSAYENLADAYAAITPTKSWNAYYEWPATRSLLPELKGKRVLDAGCGPGHYARWMVEQGAQVVGIDLTPRMLEIARAQLGDSVTLHRTDLNEPLPFLEDESFDIVLSALVCDYIRDWRRLFKEIHRVLRPEGVFVFSSQHPMMEFVHHPVGSYFDTHYTTCKWRGFGEPFDMPYYQRSLSEQINPILEAGFILERILEPLPTDEFKRVDPKDYEKLMNEPGFICFRARKPA